MRLRNFVLGTLTVAAMGAACAAVASPAWATARGAEARPGCGLTAARPLISGRNTLKGSGSRHGCSDTVTYMWVRVYKAIDFLPDTEKAVKGEQYVQNTKINAFGPCDGHGEYYTHVSTATGVSGDSVESGRVMLC
jgi:hypothetical protein